ncbi:hypothetical protein K435DRAFT_857165 [Dendrothele bispora CBS 962.96]|uniref:Uncharacterized protein n=1 Tax=Dendrothele bispora (strain CBS 962.96) TaxID=1314807 RepID=A0A4S8M6L2_DENBC|nr:hypothetical protein K435DRAFT_857165 [Dendrothele bispora CBS 962.96]
MLPNVKVFMVANNQLIVYDVEAKPSSTNCRTANMVEARPKAFGHEALLKL